MKIEMFTLKNFRNYENESLTLAPGTNILVGSNGQGKTNILEGIYYLLNGKSYRVQRETELIRWGEHAFDLIGHFTAQKRPLVINSHYEERRKMVEVNGIPIRKLSEYIGTINLISFSPDDLTMVKGGPTERRRFLDRHIAQIRPGYVGVLNQYNKVLNQKGALLKSPLGEKEKKTQLTLWNAQLTELGGRIIRARFEFVEELQQKAKTIYADISSNHEQLGMFYSSLGKNDLEQALRNFSCLLETKMDDEIERQSIQVGPHRDDLILFLQGKSARLYASQGQQRTIVLSLKLSQVELIRDDKAEYPLLLLDDVLSELDQFRRSFLLEFIRSYSIQTLLTMTNGENLPPGQAMFEIEKGSIRRQS